MTADRPTHFRVRNLERYQHYRERRPTWIKVYQELLENPDLMCLQDASKWLAVGLLLVASRYDNCVRYDPEWVGRTLHMQAPADLDAMLSVGFIEGCAASEVLATRKQSASPKSREKREERREEKPRVRTSRTPKVAAAAGPSNWVGVLVDAHDAVMGRGSGSALASRYGGAFRNLVAVHGVEAVASAIRVAWRSPEARFLSPEKIAQRYADFAATPIDWRGDLPSDTAVAV